jgi:PRC-barrel domain protein
MLKQHLAACLVGSALLTAPGFAQTSPTSPSPAQFVTQQSPGQWRASKLVGVHVHGTDDARVGDIREVLIDRGGGVEAVVIGVGGFLGIGEKDVAVPFKALDWVTEPATTASTLPSAAPPVGGPPPTPRGVTAGTTGGLAERDRAVIAVSRGYPDRAVLRMTKADLQNAPAFRYALTTGATTTTPAAGTHPPAAASPPANAPRQ